MIFVRFTELALANKSINNPIVQDALHRLSRSISAAGVSTTVTAYWVHMSQKWALNHAAKCTHLQLVEPIRVIHLVTEQRIGECNVIDIHPCNRLVHIENNLKLQMPCIFLKDKTEMIRDKTSLSIVPGSTMSCDSPLRSWVDNDIMSTALSGFRKSGKCRTKLVVWLAWISFGVILLFDRPQKTAS